MILLSYKLFGYKLKNFKIEYTIVKCEKENDGCFFQIAKNVL